MSATVKELKDMIVDLRMNLLREEIPRGHCPYFYYPIENAAGECGNVGCNACKMLFFQAMRKEIEKEVKAL